MIGIKTHPTATVYAVLIEAAQNLDAGWRHAVLGWVFREMFPKNLCLRVDIVKIRASIRLPIVSKSKPASCS